MILVEAVNTIIKRMGNRLDLKSAIEYELEYAREFKLERDPSVRPWYLLTAAPASFTTVANQAYVALPTDFLAEPPDKGFLAYTDSASGAKSFLTKREYPILSETYDTTSTGRPVEYSIQNGRVYLYPTPDAVYTLGIRYYQSAGKLSETPSTNVHLLYGADWLMAEAGVAVALANRNQMALGLFAEDLKRSKARILGESEERMYLNAEGL